MKDRGDCHETFWATLSLLLTPGKSLALTSTGDRGQTHPFEVILLGLQGAIFKDLLLILCTRVSVYGFVHVNAQLVVIWCPDPES